MILPLFLIWVIIAVVIFFLITTNYYDSGEEIRWSRLAKLALLSIVWPISIPLTFMVIAIENRRFKP